MELTIEHRCIGDSRRSWKECSICAPLQNDWPLRNPHKFCRRRDSKPHRQVMSTRLSRPANILRVRHGKSLGQYKARSLRFWLPSHHGAMYELQRQERNPVCKDRVGVGEVCARNFGDRPRGVTQESQPHPQSVSKLRVAVCCVRAWEGKKKRRPVRGSCLIEKKFTRPARSRWLNEQGWLRVTNKHVSVAC